MQEIKSDIYAVTTNQGNEKNSSINDFSSILKQYAVEFTRSSYYWQIGKITATQGWILHISVIESQISEVLSIVIPELLTQDIPFKVIRDLDTARLILAGNLGYINLGKIISIYPSSDQSANMIAKKLIYLTSKFKGPAIPTDQHLGSSVYTRYGSFNPIILNTTDGKTVKCIYDTKGNLVPDPYNIPFILLPNILWPFHDIIKLTETKPKKLLNGLYYPIRIIKSDVKGNVIHALFFKHFYQIRSCLIKQGRRNMVVDNAGRDIQDRLKWQFELHKDLFNKVPLPKIFEIFYENEDCYLAMQFIRGESLIDWLDRNFKHSSWSSLSNEKRSKILHQLIKVLEIIQLLHTQGYVHRDISPGNFLVTTSNKIFLIDMELAWNLNTQIPNPPFKQGTPGFMSPEQIAGKTPTVKDDIFGVGGLMIVFFVNLHPLKFDQYSPSDLIKTLTAIIGECQIAETIANCFHNDPTKRPPLPLIIDIIYGYYTKLNSKNELSIPPRKQRNDFKKDLENTIRLGIQGLAQGSLLTQHLCWYSPIQRREVNIGNAQLEIAIYEGWLVGLAGPLWLLGRAKYCGFPIETCLDAYKKSYKYLEQHFFKTANPSAYGLNSGGGGIALALIEGIRSGLLSYSNEIIAQLEKCFEGEIKNLSLANGISGQGLALLGALSYIENPEIKSKLDGYVQIIVNTHISSWKKGTILGLDNGLAGQIWFLLEYFVRFPSNIVKDYIMISLERLKQSAIKKKDSYSWPIAIKSPIKDFLSTANGSPGIILLFIKSYEIFKDQNYRDIAEYGLNGLPANPINNNFTLSAGLAGLGEVYLEAFRAFNNKAWLERATWIAELFINSFQNPTKVGGYWLVDGIGPISADLGIGISGILSFLIHYCSPDKIQHPLTPDHDQQKKINQHY